MAATDAFETSGLRLLSGSDMYNTVRRLCVRGKSSLPHISLCKAATTVKVLGHNDLFSISSWLYLKEHLRRC